MSSEILTVEDLCQILKCKPSAVYGMSRQRGQVRMRNPLPVLRLPMGIRFRRSDIDEWLNKVAAEQHKED